MTHINIKPLESTRVYVTEAQAIGHILAHKIWSKNWNYAASFGHTISQRRAIDNAIKENNAAAFVAFKRRGYWRIELAP